MESDLGEIVGEAAVILSVGELGHEGEGVEPGVGAVQDDGQDCEQVWDGVLGEGKNLAEVGLVGDQFDFGEQHSFA